MNGDFESFEDIDNRVSFIESSKDLIVNRVLYELIELPKIKKGRPLYLFTRVKRSNKKEVQEYDEFVTDDSRFTYTYFIKLVLLYSIFGLNYCFLTRLSRV